MANFTSGFDELPRKLEVLAGHCADVGRDVATINKTSLCTAVVAPTMEEAEQLRNGFLRGRGLDWDTLDEGTRALVGARLVVGDADAAGERVQQLVGLGLDGVTFNMPANGHDPEAVAHTVGVIRAAVG
jgi:alkanesulfonate monooxygenase SsuD/methylene tetrahydromethanopterin reductase-like flavin-dependent oxidoreductase (luciferase family)